MTQQEHMQLIRAKCVELLELAKQRTPGRWSVDPCSETVSSDQYTVAWELDEKDAAFIASASGPFEAALASTVAAIDALCLAVATFRSAGMWECCAEAVASQQSIIDSWPLELLQP